MQRRDVDAAGRKLPDCINWLPLRLALETHVEELALLRRIASAKLPFRLQTSDDFNAAKSLMASGYVKVSLPLMRNGRGTYGKQDDAHVSAITSAGRRALTP
jgi:hypothetical protein